MRSSPAATATGVTTPAPEPTVADTSAPVTTAVVRRVAAGREQDFVRWTEAGIALARTFDGFLGGGWVRSAAGDEEFHVLYRFADDTALRAWTRSSARSAWVDRGVGVAEDTAVHRRTGMEGWFAPPGPARPVPVAPPRWKQAVTIWLGFFPMSLLVNWVLVPHLHALDVVTRTLATTLVVTPVMVFLVLPFVTARLRGWLQRPH